MTGRNDVSEERTAGRLRLPARYRKTIRARLHYLFWSLVLLLLWPLSMIFRGIEKLLRHEKQD